MRITSRAPTRVDLAGGTIDIWPLYLFHDGAETINFATTLYAGCAVEPRDDARIVLESTDLGLRESFEDLEALRRATRHRLPLPALLVRFFAPKRGLTLVTGSEAPAGAGIAGSSAMNIATCAALARLTGMSLSKEKLIQVAKNVEAQVIRVPTGDQDYYPATYGGVNAVRLTPAGVVREAIEIDHDALLRRVVLAYTGAPRQSGINNWEVMKAHIDGHRQVIRNFDKIAEIARALHAALARQDWEETGRLIRAEWANRKRNAPGITTPFIEELVKISARNGGSAAKVCGAGGGGCVLFFVKDGAKERVSRALAAAGARVLDTGISRQGVTVKVLRGTGQQAVGSKQSAAGSRRLAVGSKR
jgi:D-glycero-alpha-D-manno-heptose-7-phosphate kinase